MNLLSSNFSPTQLIDFYTFPKDQVSTEMGPDKDFIVGLNAKVVMTIANRTTFECRDIVVFGHLTIQSKNTESKEEDFGKLIGRSFIVMTPRSRQQLQDVVVEWLDYQRESTKKIGLRSILI